MTKQNSKINQIAVSMGASASLMLGTHPSVAATTLRWEKIHVVHTLPSQVFQKLGLTHNTRYGHNRGSKSGESDPGFPAGLTDVVPYDHDDVLIVRGTVAGLDKFRKTVNAADVPAMVYQLTSQLIAEDTNGTSKVLDTVQTPLVVANRTVTVSIGNTHIHQFTIKLEPALGEGTLVTEQSAVALSGSTQSATFLPPIAWTKPAIKTLYPAQTVDFAGVPVGADEVIPKDTVLVLRVQAEISAARAAIHETTPVNSITLEVPQPPVRSALPAVQPFTSHVPTDALGN